MNILRESKFYLLDLGLLYRKPLFLLRGFVRYLQNYFSKGRFLVGVSFATTYDCNFNCNHCYAKNFRRTNKKPLSLEEKKEVIKECINLGAISFDFVGGEISLSDELEQLVKACEPSMTYISLATNGYDMNRQKLQKFRNWGIDKLSISIDRWDEAEHDRFRNKPGSHKKCFQTLQLCREVGIKPVIIMTVVKNFTKTEDFKKMVEFAIKNKIQLVFSPAIPFGKWEGNFEVLVTKDDLQEMERLHKLHPILTRDNYSNMGKFGCPAFKQIIYITEYGDVLPCAFTHITFGNVREESINSIRNSTFILDYFGKYHTSCLAGEDEKFIKRYLSKNYSSKIYPVHATEIFKEMAEYSTKKTTKRNIKKTLVKCAICESDDYEVIAQGREHEFENTTDDTFHVTKCKSCGLIYLNPRPDMSEFDTIYPDNYYCHTDNLPGMASKESLLGMLKQQLISEMGFPKRIRSLLKKYPIDTEISVIDIGCGNGAALDAFKKIGGDHIKTYGVDFDDMAILATSKKGHTAYRTLFEEADLPKGTFDIVYSSNVIEHVADPAEFMKKVSDVLKPGGLFLCETPNIGSVEARILKKSGHWGGYHFPRHWTFFTPKHIKMLGEKFGLEVLNIEYFPVPIFWIWTFHSLIFNATTKNKGIADTFFPLLENNRNFIYSFLLKINFTVWDYIIKLFTGSTALMCVTLQKGNP